MCYHVSQREKSPERIVRMYGKEMVFEKELMPVYNHLNGFEHGNLMVITQDDPDVIQLATWGIVPPNYTGDFTEYRRKYAGGVLNTRDDKFFLNNTWKDDSIEERKCLIIVDGIYEPRKVEGHKPIPYFFERENSEHFCLWGIYTQHDELITCSVLTTRANPLFEEIHNGAKRMPFCIHPDDVDYYLRLKRERDIKMEFVDFESVELEVRPVSRDVMNSHVKSNYEGITDKVDYPELNTLF